MEDQSHVSRATLYSAFFSRLFDYRFAIAAFLIPVGVRAIPELLVGPYQVGWDTIAFYVPNTLDWAGGRVGVWQMLGTAPLMYMISVPVYVLSGVSPVWIFKIMGPVLYGMMMLALFRFLRLGLKWTERMSLGAVLFASLYFVTLRISWDLYRNMLGLTFILLSLPLFRDWKNPKNQALLAVLTFLSVASDQLTGVISLALIGARVLAAIADKRRDEVTRMIRIGSPGAVLFSAIAYFSLITPGIGFLQSQTPLPTLASLGSSVGYLGFAYLLLSPLFLFGLRRVPSFEIKNWSILCAVLVALALLPFFGPVAQSYRWTLLVDIPVCVYASAGLARLIGHARPTIGWVRMIHRWTLPLVSSLLIVSASFYIALPAQQAMIYYTAFPGLLPTSMVQDTVPSYDMGNLRVLLDSAASSMEHGTALIAHQAMYGWARVYLPSLQDRVINYQYDSPLAGVSMAESLGYSSILMIWWVNGTGWHGQPNVPAGFNVLQQSGELALYKYH